MTAEEQRAYITLQLPHLAEEQLQEIISLIAERGETVLWEDLPQHEREGIKRGLADIQAGRVVPHATIQAEIQAELED
jgi:hypothetical protein